MDTEKMDTEKMEKMDNEADPSETTNEQNKTICRQINVQLREFFDDIYISFNCFKRNEWKISKVLYDNEDALFYNELFFTGNDNMKFNEVFAKYIAMIEEIMTADNQLYVFLKNWTDKSNFRWKANLKSQNSYLKGILTNGNYQIISPSYITDIYCELGKQYRDNEALLKQLFENKLNHITHNTRTETSKFKQAFNSLLESYVYEQPLEYEQRPLYTLAFLNGIVMTIMDYAEKLIDLNVYAIHAIISQLIEYYIPLDEINGHDPSKNNNCEIIII